MHAKTIYVRRHLLIYRGKEEMASRNEFTESVVWKEQADAWLQLRRGQAR